MTKPDVFRSIRKGVRFYRNHKRATRQNWSKVIALLLTSALFLLPLQFFQVAPVHALAGRVDDHLGSGETPLLGTQGEKSQPADWSGRYAPLRQLGTTTLKVEIISSPWATVDSNLVALGDAGLPGAFVVEAAITNIGTVPATGVQVTLDYQENEAGGWVLLSGEDPIRIAGDLAPDEVYYAYWFAEYPHNAKPENIPVPSHDYTVTAQADNANPVSTSNNAYGNPPSGDTVQIRSSLNTGSSGIIESSAEIVVGVAFTVTVVYGLGEGADDIIFSPVGNADFAADAYRLLNSRIRFYDEGNTQETIVADRLYFPTVPMLPDNSVPDLAEAIFNFIAVLPSNTTLCPYAAIRFGSNPKYDEQFCSDTLSGSIPVTGTLTLSQTKQVSSSTIEQGQVLTYTISYMNTGDDKLQFARFWDDVPDGLSVITTTITPTADPDESSDTRVAWNLGEIPPAGQPGSSGTLRFAAVVDGGGQDLENGTTLVNQAFFGVSQSGLPRYSALTSTVTTTVQAPLITLSKTDGREVAGPGETLIYTLHIANSGPTEVTGLVITDVLPADVTYTPLAAIPDETDRNGQTLVWDNLGPIPSGGAIDIQVPVVINSDVANETTLLNTMTVDHQNEAGHTFAKRTATDTTVARVPVLEFTKEAEDLNGPPLGIGDIIRYTLEVTNTGTYTAHNVLVTDNLPDQVTCQQVLGDSPPAGCADPLEWSIASLAPDSSAKLTVDVTINPGTEWQHIINTGSVEADNVSNPPEDPPPVCPDGSQPAGDQCPSTPLPPDTTLAFTKTAEDVNGAPLAIGDTIRYTLEVTNTGTYTAFNVAVTDNLPDEVTCQEVSGDSPPESCADLLEWVIPSLGPDSTARLMVDVTVNAGTEGDHIVNTGSVTAVNVPEPPDDPLPVCPDGSQPVEGQCPTTPGSATTLELTKRAEDVNGPPIEIGDTIKYTLEVTNTGTHTAYNVIVTDDLPDEVTCQQVSGDSPPAGCADPLEWTIASLAPDSTVRLTIEVTIKPGAGGKPIINTGSVIGGNVPVPPDDPPPVCPDGEPPVDGQCSGPEPSDGRTIFLPLILKNMK